MILACIQNAKDDKKTLKVWYVVQTFKKKIIKFIAIWKL